jgi:predicted phage tail protein
MNELVPVETCRVVARPHPFSTERTECTVKAGATIAELLAEAVPDRALHRYAHVSLIDDAMAREAMPVPREVWERVRPKPGTRVQITIVPMGGRGKGGGKNPLRTVLSIAVIAASFFLGATLGGLIVGEVGSTFLGLTVTKSLQAAVGGFIIPCGGPLLFCALPPQKEVVS